MPVNYMISFVLATKSAMFHGLFWSAITGDLNNDTDGWPFSTKTSVIYLQLEILIPQ